MHPAYPDLTPNYRLTWKESKNIPIAPLAPDWKFPMYDCQLTGNDLDRLNADLRDIVLEKREQLTEHTKPSQKMQNQYGDMVTTTTLHKDWNFFHIDHPAVETLFYYMKDAHDHFINDLDVIHGEQVNLLCWMNCVEADDQNVLDRHCFKSDPGLTYMDANYCVTADEDTATVFDPPGFNDRLIHVTNKPGQLTLFPMWVDHWTTPFKRDDTRITISAALKLGELSKHNVDPETGEHINYLPFDDPPHVKARQNGLALDDIEGVDPDVVNFVNTPLEEVKSENIELDFKGR